MSAGLAYHVPPPHLLPDSIRSTPKSLGGCGEVVCLVLQRIEALTTLGDLVDIFTHYSDGVIDLLQRVCTLAGNDKPVRIKCSNVEVLGVHDSGLVRAISAEKDALPAETLV